MCPCQEFGLPQYHHFIGSVSSLQMRFSQSWMNKITDFFSNESWEHEESKTTPTCPDCSFQTPVICLQSQNCDFSGTLCIKILWSLFMYCIYLQLKWNKLFTIIYKFNKRLALSTFVCILGRSGNLFWFSDIFFLFPILCNSWSPRLLRNKRKTFISPVKKNTLTFGCGIEIQGI